MAEDFLEVRDLRKAYNHNVALQGVSFEVHEGEMFGLLGPNGAGKTTLLSIISCLLSADSGCVRLFGREINPRDRDVRRLIGVVPQDLALYSNLTARENLLFFGQLYGLRGANLTDRVEALLTAVGLTERANGRVSTFSGGMKRRLNLAAGLIHGPRLLLLDEPTTGVDPQSRNLVFEEVRRVNREGMTIVYTSHYMEEVQVLCTRIGIMDHGKLIACDTLPGLLSRQEGMVRFRVPEMSARLRQRLQTLAGCKLLEGESQQIPGDGVLVTLACHDVKTTLLHLGPVLNDAGMEPVGLETSEPNLESVFLHLTGKGLRD